jgi:hypothetical protein
MTDYLTVVEVLAIHDDQIDRYAGSAGVRDRVCSKRPCIVPRRDIMST